MEGGKEQAQGLESELLLVELDQGLRNPSRIEVFSLGNRSALPKID
jgi:hypothetical protein